MTQEAKNNVIRDMMDAARSLRESLDRGATNEEVREDAIELLDVVERFICPPDVAPYSRTP